MLKIKLDLTAALVAQRPLVRHEKAAYLFCATNRSVPYPLGRSRIVYIGSTNYVTGRVPASAAERAKRILGKHGIRGFSVFIVTCPPVQKVKPWHKLERALLIRFRERYGRQPMCNVAGKRLTQQGEFSKYFRRDAIDSILETLEGKSFRG